MTHYIKSFGIINLYNSNPFTTIGLHWTPVSGDRDLSINSVGTSSRPIPNFRFTDASGPTDAFRSTDVLDLPTPLNLPTPLDIPTFSELPTIPQFTSVNNSV